MESGFIRSRSYAYYIANICRDPELYGKVMSGEMSLREVGDAPRLKEKSLSLGNVTQVILVEEKPISKEISAKEARIELAKLGKAKIEEIEEKEGKIKEIFGNAQERDGESF